MWAATAPRRRCEGLCNVQPEATSAGKPWERQHAQDYAGGGRGRRNFDCGRVGRMGAAAADGAGAGHDRGGGWCASDHQDARGQRREGEARRQRDDRRGHQGVVLRHQARLVHRRHRHAAGGRQPALHGDPHLPRAHARHRRRASPLGPAAAEHHDQRDGRSGGDRDRRSHADAQVQGRREEDRRRLRLSDRHLHAGRQGRAQAGREDFHQRRGQERGRHARGPPYQCRPRRRAADVSRQEHPMSSLILRTLTATALLAAAATTISSTWAQQPQTMRIRGTVEKVDGNTVVVKATDGASVTLTLTDKAVIVGVVKASLAEIKEGSYVGSAAMPQADGSQKALEVHIFAESQRGTGEGHRPFTVPNSTMTNGTVGATVTATDGHTLTVKYAGGEKKIVVPPDVPVVRYEIGDRSELKPGVHITALNAVKKADGSIEAPRLNVGRAGLVPQ